MNDEETRKPASTAITVRQEHKIIELAKKVLGRSRDQDHPEDAPLITVEEAGETRSVRRGKFFLSNRVQAMHGSFRRPIFQFWGHGVVVGEMYPVFRENVEDPEGMWCYGAHNDFDLIPEFIKPSEWPEYVRTETGWVRKNETVSNEEFQKSFPKPTLDQLLNTISTLKRLK